MSFGDGRLENRPHSSPPSDTLLLLAGRPNPTGAGAAAVFLLRGDATAAPIAHVLLSEGLQYPPTRLPLAKPARIRLLHFNDLHGHVCGFLASGATQPVFSRLANLLRKIRGRGADDPQSIVLTVTAGDDCGGAIFDELLGQDAGSCQGNAAYRLYSAAGVDVGVVGNHDLDRGDAVLAEAVRRDARFPVLAANVVGSAALAQAIFPAALYVVQGIRIGFVGLVTPAQRYPEPGCPWHITDPVEAARNLLPAMRPHCDVLIILSHLGRSLAERGAHVQVAGDVELARSLPPGSVDLIVGAHTHSALNPVGLSADNIVNGIPIVQAGSSGQYLGEVELTVGEMVSVTLARLHLAGSLPADGAFEREHVQPLVDRVQPHRSRSLGRVADDTGLSPAAVRNGFAVGEMALANFVTDAMVAQAREHGYPVDLAMVDRSTVSCGLPAGGELTYGAWFEVMPYADVLGLCRLTGRDLRALVHDNVLRMDRPGEPQAERGFLHFSAAVRYAIEWESRCPAAKVAAASAGSAQAHRTRILINGDPIEACLDRTFLVVSTSFVRGLATAWEASVSEAFAQKLFDLAKLPWEYTTLRVRALLVDHILAHGGVLPEGGARLDGRLALLVSK